MNALYDIINILPLSALTVMFFGRYFGMPEESIIGYITGLIFSAWMILLKHIQKKNRIRSIGIVTVFLAVLTIAAGETRRQLFMTEYGWLGWIMIISGVSVAAGMIMERSVWSRRLISLSLIVYCIVAMVFKWEMEKAAPALICFLLLIHIAEEIQRRWNKSGYSDLKEHITRLSPILLILCICIFALPAPNEPYDWKAVKTIYNTAAAYLNRLSGMIAHPSEEYGNIGFSDNGVFLAGLKSSDEEVLRVSVNSNSIKNLRLIGCVSGEFAGDRWIFDTKTESRSRMMDTLETTCAVRKYDSEHPYDYICKTKICYENLMYNTKYIFAPSKMQVSISEQNSPEYREKNNSILTEKRMNYGDQYSVSCYMFNYNCGELFDLLDSAQPIESSEWEKNAEIENIANTDGYSFEDYQEYRSSIYRNYCQTDGVSDEVSKILDEIKAGSNSSYETMKNLESYLNKMEYTTNAGELPSDVTDGKSFLDYFLLTSQKGYCMHYATAFVLMARELGMPCRYVQGYYVHKDFAEDAVIKQSNAHAWPEVYFDNVGWVTFEPTPGYSIYNGWKVIGGKKEHTDIPESNIVPSDIDDEIAGIIEQNDEEKKSAHIDVRFLIIPILSAAGFLILFYAVNGIVFQKRYRRMGYDDKFRYLTKENLKFLNYLGFRMETGETLNEYKNRVSNSEIYDLKEHLGFISNHEKMLYSNIEISEYQVDDAERTYHLLREMAMKSKLRYRIMLLFRR
ncbi:MAG: transglutaminase family protein [Oscillospiraceae bacterium]